MAKDETTLWNNWFKEKSTCNLHGLLSWYQEWLTKIARKFYFEFYVSSYEIGDYLHWATIGMIESFHRYERIEGAQFKTYAYKRIRGEILNQLNKATEELAQAKSLKKQKERVESLAKHNESKDRFERLYDVTVGIMIGNLLETELESENNEEHLISEIYDNQLTIRLSGLLNKLPDKEKNVLSYHYYYHLKFSEIGEIMSLTKGRVSQLHSKAISQIKEQMLLNDFEIFL